MRKWDVRGWPVFVLDEFRSVAVLTPPGIDGLVILFGVWDGERNWS